MTLSSAEYLASFAASLTPLPAVQPGICRYCHSSTGRGFDCCYPCGHHPYGRPILPIVSEVRSGFAHNLLYGYKDESARSEVRKEQTLRLAALLNEFLAFHGDCLGEFDEIATVPSMERDAPRLIVQRLRRFRDAYPPGLLRATARGQFDVTRSIENARVLVLDDTFTSGQSVFGACAAVEGAGGRVVGPLTIGRFMNPGWAETGPVVAALRHHEFEIGRCAWCSGIEFDPPLTDGMF